MTVDAFRNRVDFVFVWECAVADVKQELRELSLSRSFCCPSVFWLIRSLIVNLSCLNMAHNSDIGNDCETICARPARGITGATCRKSPQNNMTLPPNGSSLSSKTRSVRSTHSITHRRCIGASSQIISFASFISFNDGCFAVISHVDVSVILIGILNRECAVRPPSKFVAATPELAHGRAISPRRRTSASSVWQTNDFP